MKFQFRLHFKCSNNQAEYEALIVDLYLLVDMSVQSINVMGDS